MEKTAGILNRAVIDTGSGGFYTLRTKIADTFGHEFGELYRDFLRAALLSFLDKEEQTRTLNRLYSEMEKQINKKQIPQEMIDLLFDPDQEKVIRMIVMVVPKLTLHTAPTNSIHPDVWESNMDYSKMNDEKLADLVYWNQSTEAFEQIVLRWQNHVYKWCFVAREKDQEQATQMAQEVFVTLWHKLTDKPLKGAFAPMIRSHVMRAVAKTIEGRK